MHQKILCNVERALKCRELLERILREKPQRKTRLSHPQSSSFNSLNFSTLTLSIDISLRGTLAKSLSHHTHIYEEVIWCLESSSEETNSFWLKQWATAGSGKLEKTRFDVTLLQQEAQRAQVHWVDQAWRVFCYSCIPILFFSGSFERLEGGGEVFSPSSSVSSSITHADIIFVFASLFSYSLPFNCCYVCD